MTSQVNSVYRSFYQCSVIYYPLYMKFDLLMDRVKSCFPVTGKIRKYDRIKHKVEGLFNQIMITIRQKMMKGKYYMVNTFCGEKVRKIRN